MFTDNAHALDRVDAAAAAAQSPEALSEGAKRLKQRMLKRIVVRGGCGWEAEAVQAEADCGKRGL